MQPQRWKCMKSLIVPWNLQFATGVYIKKHIIDLKIVIKNKLESGVTC